MPSPARSKVFAGALAVALAFLLLTTLASFNSTAVRSRFQKPARQPPPPATATIAPPSSLSPQLTPAAAGASSPLKAAVPGAVVMSKMANETLKAELGRAAWRVLHTMAGKFPTDPNTDEQQAMQDYIYLFARLYPCGDCARHFKRVLEAHPPRVSSREAVSQWACDVHNVVNKRLGKPHYDCKEVLAAWGCGCAEDDPAALAAAASTSTVAAAAASAATVAVALAPTAQPVLGQ
ncbi:hypothetical protein HDU86_001546 [Geranomyces michiganensis]|nr:hypothetical protein HDU86_001546 [Geranomyces michiganensis]